ncbi:septum formation initiator [Bifidobacterium rousetti]|uniref:FtsB family cell division protein n=1 Tax=Bifidobacterium rousetti TaxID=2045439 RepID=UPI00123B3BD6|nr:septum formation initiator family protein [Bifidobacterium rousetti]KAA8819746.1 septum formation initiator [Bifidobacterium rousetti]
MSTRNRNTPKDAKRDPKDKALNVKKRQRSGNFGPIAFFVSLFIVAVGAIQLVSTFNTYATDLAHLNSLKRQEAALIAQKQELENDISRWNDKNYVAAQARERLGFVFPGEQSVLVQNPQAVTGDEGADTSTTDKTASGDTSKQLPWYSELSYAFKKADEPADDTTANAKNGTNTTTNTDTNTTNTKEQ